MNSVTVFPVFWVVLVRGFGWCMLGLLVAFLANNYLTVSLDWPGIEPIFRAQVIPADAWIQGTFFLLAMLAAILFVFFTPARSLRDDSAVITRVNMFLVRAAFWAVVYVGLADMLISFLRVENLLSYIVGAELTTELGRSMFRGPNVHVPLMYLGVATAMFSRTLGFHWLALLIVIAELTIVITRFVFSYEQAFMGDLVRFWYAALFLFASAYTLLEEGHVRVDVFYTGFTSRTKGMVNAIGSIVLGMSVSWTIIIVSMGSRTAIVNSPMLNYEISQSGFGMYTKYLMAGYLAVFAITMLIQFVAYLMAAVADFREGDAAGTRRQKRLGGAV